MYRTDIYVTHWHVSSRPEREACRYRIQRFFGISSGAIPQTICKITESFRFERDRKTKKSEEKDQTQLHWNISSDDIFAVAPLCHLPYPSAPHCLHIVALSSGGFFSLSLSVFFGVSQKKNSWQRDTSYIIKVDRLALDLSMGSRRSSKFACIAVRWAAA